MVSRAGPAKAGPILGLIGGIMTLGMGGIYFLPIMGPP